MNILVHCSRHKVPDDGDGGGGEKGEEALTDWLAGLVSVMSGNTEICAF